MVVTVGLEPTSATFIVVIAHRAAHSLKFEKESDDKQVEPTSVRSMVVRSPWSGLPSPFRANKLESLPASQDSPPGCRFSRLPRRCVHISASIGANANEHNQRKRATARVILFVGGDSWTRTNDPIDVNDVLYRLSHATLLPLKFLAARTVN